MAIIDATKSPAKQTGFAAESQTQNPTAALTLFAPVTTLAVPEGMKRVSSNRMVLPDQIPVGSAIDCVILSAVDSPASSVKGKCLNVRVWGTEIEVLLSVTGTIREALAPKVGADDSKALLAALNTHVGKRLQVIRQPDGTTKKGAEEGKTRKMYLFDVRLSEKKVVDIKA